MGLTVTILPAWLTNFVAAYGLARSMAAYGGLRRRLGGSTISYPVEYAEREVPANPDL